MYNTGLYQDYIKTPLGRMVSIASDEALYLLEFTDRSKFDAQIKRLESAYGSIEIGQTKISKMIAAELEQYFAGDLQDFKTPMQMTGTEFQKSVWRALCEIPHGQTRSYSELAEAVGSPKAVRATASSNARNGLALIIPCHRVISKSGGLGGYAGGIKRKAALLELEAS